MWTETVEDFNTICESAEIFDYDLRENLLDILQLFTRGSQCYISDAIQRLEEFIHYTYFIVYEGAWVTCPSGPDNHDLQSAIKNSEAYRNFLTTLIDLQDQDCRFVRRRW